ncbi:hypothetical protein MNBD_GAMMA08-1600, partial [hydrothermal vent metagenome]
GHEVEVFSRSNALRWNAYTSGRLSLNASNETGYVVYEFPRRTVGTREKEAHGVSSKPCQFLVGWSGCPAL